MSHATLDGRCILHPAPALKRLDCAKWALNSLNNRLTDKIQEQMCLEEKTVHSKKPPAGTELHG